MKYFIAIAIFIAVGFGAKAQQVKCDTIPWAPTLELTWDNFKGKPDMSTSFKALTQSGMYCSRSMNDKQVVLHSGSSFMSCASWTKVNSDSVLMHERLHFDITEYYRRVLMQRSAKGTYNMKNCSEKLNAIYSQVYGEWQKEQEKYDAETNHGIIHDKQAEWEQKVKEQLKSLEEYSGADLTIVFK